MDLVEGHLAALNYLLDPRAALLTVNLGTGCGYSVLDMVRAFEAASGRPVPYRADATPTRRCCGCYADPQLAKPTCWAGSAAWHR
jgi:UDP-glucose 4-epimerase